MCRHSFCSSLTRPSTCFAHFTSGRLPISCSLPHSTDTTLCTDWNTESHTHWNITTYEHTLSIVHLLLTNTGHIVKEILAVFNIKQEAKGKTLCHTTTNGSLQLLKGWLCGCVFYRKEWVMCRYDTQNSESNCFLVNWNHRSWYHLIYCVCVYIVQHILDKTKKRLPV